MSKYHHAVWIVLVLLLSISMVYAQGGIPDQTVKIAVLVPLTGPAASIGTEQLNWAQLAVSDFIETTGWNVELVTFDTQLDPEIAATSAGQIINDYPDIYGVVGPASSREVQATAQMFFDARLVHVSGFATDPDLTQMGYDTFFRTVPSYTLQGLTDPTFIYETLGETTLFIIDDQSPYSVALADQAQSTFTELGGEVLGHESVTPYDTDFSALVTLIGASGAKAVFFPGQMASQGVLLARAIQEQGVDVTLVSADGFFSAENYITGADGATEGAYVSFFAPDIRQIETSSEVANRYLEQYGEFTPFGPPTYAATTVVLEAMQRAFESDGLSRESVRNEVANTNQELSILGGPLSFDHGDISDSPVYMFQVQGNQFVSIEAFGFCPCGRCGWWRCCRCPF